MRNNLNLSLTLSGSLQQPFNCLGKTKKGSGAKTLYGLGTEVTVSHVDCMSTLGPWSMYNKGLQYFILDGNQTENDEIGKKTLLLQNCTFSNIFLQKVKSYLLASIYLSPFDS
jgi:hypothetical protein